MVFTGTKETCPNYDSASSELDMSYRRFGDLQVAPVAEKDPLFGKAMFNKTCFNICPTINDDDDDDDDTNKGPTYIDGGICKVCLDEDGDSNNPREGTKNNLKNAGKYEMCNFPGDDDSGSTQGPGGLGMVWFDRQQDANLLGIPTQMIDEMVNEDGPALNSLNSFSDMLSGLQYDSAFEACVNDKLNTGDDDLDLQTRITSYTSVKEFTNKDINYLKRKLRKIITMKSQQVQECMNLLNLGKSMCQTGVADKTLMIGSLIFSIVGNDKIDIMQADNDERYKINKLVDELGPLVPLAIKNIIAISKEYESRVCNVPSNTTLLLERLYTDLYDKPTHVSLDFSPYLDFASLINMNDNVKFIKTIVVLVVFAFLFMHGSNLVIAFLSRGSKSD